MRPRTTLSRGLILSATVILAAACSHASAPAALVNARSAYMDAHADPNTRLASVQLHEAQQALVRAEDAWVDDGDTPRTRDLAYVAHRKAEIAMVEGRVALLRAQTDETHRAQARARDQRLQDTNRQLSQTQGQLDRERHARMDSERERSEAVSALGQSESARREAEQRADAAMSSLREMALVREESRGTVITLSGAVLFPVGSTTLLPIARQRLDDVAEALIARAGAGPILVEGHTDSRGSPVRNAELAQARAEAVVVYLVTRGVPTDSIRAVGVGAARPVADNATAEGRANNRRVEIVIPPGSRQTG